MAVREMVNHDYVTITDVINVDHPLHFWNDLGWIKNIKQQQIWWRAGVMGDTAIPWLLAPNRTACKIILPA